MIADMILQVLTSDSMNDLEGLLNICSGVVVNSSFYDTGCFVMTAKKFGPNTLVR